MNFSALGMVAESWKKPEDVAGSFTSQRWRKFLTNLHSKANYDYRIHYGKYLCRRWELRQGHLGRLYQFKIHYMYEKTPRLNAVPEKVKDLMLWHHRCYIKDTSKVEEKN